MEETPQAAPEPEQTPPPAEYIPPPPPPDAAEAQPKKNNTVWWVVGCGCALFLCVALVVLAVVFSTVLGGFLGIGALTGYKAMTAPVAPIKAQLAALNAGDVRKAYDDYTSAGFKRSTSFDDFEQMVESHPEIFKSKDSSFTNISIKNDFATVTGTITGKDGTVTRMEYQLVRANGEWKIQRFEEK